MPPGLEIRSNYCRRKWWFKKHIPTNLRHSHRSKPALKLGHITHLIGDMPYFFRKSHSLSFYAIDLNNIFNGTIIASNIKRMHQRCYKNSNNFQ